MVKSATVGVLELRQRLSHYLSRVRAGETIEVTADGRPIALLGPVPVAADPIERLVQEGRLQRAVGDLLDLGLPRSLPLDMPVSEALARERGEG